MTKAEVIAIMGNPMFTAAHNGREFLAYYLATSSLDMDRSDTAEYFVMLTKGFVEAYGKRGDFGTTELPQTRHKIEIINK